MLFSGVSTVNSGVFSEALYVEYSLPMAGVVSNKLFSGALFFTGKSGFYSGSLLSIAPEA